MCESAQEEQSPGITLHRKQDEDWRQTRSQRPIAGAGSADPGRFGPATILHPSDEEPPLGTPAAEAGRRGACTSHKAWLKCARVADSSGVPASSARQVPAGCMSSPRRNCRIMPSSSFARPERFSAPTASSAPCVFSTDSCEICRRIPKSLLTRQSARCRRGDHGNLVSHCLRIR